MANDNDDDDNSYSNDGQMTPSATATMANHGDDNDSGRQL